MTRYSLLVSLHVASVIVWLGSGTTLVFVAIYAQRARNRVVLEQLGALVQWMALRVFAPAALAAFAFGVAAAHEGHWPDLFWFHVGEGAFAFSFLLTVAVRLPLLRRARRGTLDSVRLGGIGTSAVRNGAGVLALGLVAAVAVAYRARSAQPVIAVSPLREYGTMEDDEQKEESGRDSESESTGSRAA
jgi:hypothetical protein